jgi:hypothetical protein
MGSLLCPYQECSSGIRDFQRAVNPLNMNHSLEDFQLKKRITMWLAVVRSERLLAVRMIDVELNLNRTMVHRIFTQEVAMRKLWAKNLTIEQKYNRKHVCLHHLEWIQSYRNFFKNVITVDDTWIFEYDPETKRQGKEWHNLHHHFQKSEKEKVKNKTHAYLLFDSHGIVHTEFVPQGKTVNHLYYREILERLSK